MHLYQARPAYIRWLLATRDFSPHTIRAYDSDIAAFERHLGPEAEVSKIDRTVILSFIEDQRVAGVTARSIRRRASGIRGFCRWLQSCQMLDDDPWASVALNLRRPSKLPRPVSTADLDRLLGRLCREANVPTQHVPDGPLNRPHESTTLLAVALMVTTGMRVSEVTSLACRDVDLPGRSVRVVGKGLRERQVFITNDWLSTLIRAYLTTRDMMKLGHDHVFFNRHGAPLAPSAIRSRLRRAGELAGLSTQVTPHMLRHTAATQLLEAGVDIRFVQRLLGHASLTTTEIYTHVSDRALKRVVSDADVLGRAFHERAAQ